MTTGSRRDSWDRRVDKILTGKYTGIPILLLLLFFLLWLTIAGANLPSRWIWQGVLMLWSWLSGPMAEAPWWLRGALLDGMLLTAGRVVSVMLPPMAIFFPLFTLLEDLGYLPRMAYNLDHALEGCGGCGKMALTMCMGHAGAELVLPGPAALQPGGFRPETTSSDGEQRARRRSCALIRRGSSRACRQP